jgi:hypothetical protein
MDIYLKKGATTPGIVINEKVKHSGKPLPRMEQIKGWIEEEKLGR